MAAAVSAPQLAGSLSASAVQSSTATASTRRDGRTPSQLRPLSYEQSILHRADGSVRYTQGNTTVVVAVYGPTVASHREEQWDEAVLLFTFDSTAALSSTASPLCAATGTFSSAALCHHLHATFAPIVLLSLHPRHRISVHVELLSDDGGLLAAAVNATMLALMDAGIQCREMIAAVELRVRHDTNAALEDKRATQLLLDPDREETEVSPAAAALSTAHTADAAAGAGQRDSRAGCLIGSLFVLSVCRRVWLTA